MSDFFIIILVCITTCILSVLLKQYLKEQSLLLILAVSSIIIIKLAGSFMPIAEIVNSTFKDIEIDSEFFNILLKSLAISYITKLAESICKDCNENAMSLLVQTSGKISITVLSIPMFLEIIRILTEVLK